MKRFVIRTSVVGLAALGSAIPLAAQQVKPTVFEVSPVRRVHDVRQAVRGSDRHERFGRQWPDVRRPDEPNDGQERRAVRQRRLLELRSEDRLPILGGLNVGSSKALLYDGGIELKVPMQAASMVTPFVQGGVGGDSSTRSSPGS